MRALSATLAAWMVGHAEPPMLELSDLPQEAYDQATESVVGEMLRLAELRQHAVLHIATAADARAVQMLAGCAALATAAFGAAAALAAAGRAPDMVIAATTAGCTLALAAGLAAWAARPERSYRAPGLEPWQVWAESVVTGTRRDLLLIALGESQRAIAQAAAATRSRARAMGAALFAVTAAPIVSAAAWLVARAAG